MDLAYTGRTDRLPGCLRVALRKLRQTVPSKSRLCRLVLLKGVLREGNGPAVLKTDPHPLGGRQVSQKRKRPVIAHCPTCGGKVLMPCRLCSVRADTDPRAYGEGDAASVALDLAGKHRAAYEELPTPQPTREVPERPDGRLVSQPVPFLKTFRRQSL